MLLIITNHYYQSWHPNANRIRGLVTELKKQNLLVTVLQHGTSSKTVVSENEARIHFMDPFFGKGAKMINSVSNKTLKRVFTWVYRLVMTYPLGQSFYVPSELKSKMSEIDLILATGPSFESHVLASKLSEAFKIPWVGDYRDLWTTEGGRVRKRHMSRRLLDLLEAKKERRTIKTARLISTVTLLMKMSIERGFPEKKVFLIENGFENAMKEVSRQPPDSEEFRLIYLGSLYHNQDRNNNFFKGLKLFIDGHRGAKIKITFLGTDLSKRREEWKRLESYIEITSRMSPEEMAIQFSSSHVCIHMGIESAEAMATAKVYDYLASGREILYVSGQEGELSKMMEEQAKVHHANSPEEVRDVLSKLYNRFDLGESFFTNKEPSSSLSRSSQSFRWAELLQDHFDF